MLLGKYFSSFLVVIQAPAWVFSAKFLYLIESKNVKSSFFARIRGFILLIVKFFFQIILGNIFFIFIFFFIKKIEEDIKLLLV